MHVKFGRTRTRTPKIAKNSAFQTIKEKRSGTTIFTVNGAQKKVIEDKLHNFD